MQAFHKDKQQVSLFAPQYCDSDRISPLIDPDEKVSVIKGCSGNCINLIDCRCPDVELYINDVGGLDMLDKRIYGASVRINQDFPVIPPDCFNMNPGEIDSKIVGVRLTDILSVGPKMRRGIYQLDDGVRLDFTTLSSPVFQGKKIILVCNGIDAVIEKLWWLREHINLYGDIASAGFYAVVGMNFSLFIGECPLGQLININKSLTFAQELSRHGISVIPHVYAVSDQQREKWVDFLKVNPNIPIVAINTQLQKNDYSKNQATKTVNKILGETSADIILVGQTLGIQGRGRIISAKQSTMKTAMIKNRALLQITDQIPVNSTPRNTGVKTIFSFNT